MASSGYSPSSSAFSASRISLQSLTEPRRHRRQAPSIVPGLLLAIMIAAGATVVGNWLPLLGASVTGLLAGLLIRNTLPLGATFIPGLRFAASEVLKWSIVGLGFGLGVQQVVQTGMASLSVTLVTIGAAFVSAWLLGKWLGVPDRLKTLIGVGTAICGGSAIAAVAPIIRPAEHETAFAISTIFLFNIVAVLVFPPMGHMLGMSDMGFGMWAGTAINDTSSVVAAGYAYSHVAGDYATIVKLTRATLIIPVCLVLLALQLWHRKRSGVASLNLRSIFPWFILWFVVASAVYSAGWVPVALEGPIRAMSGFLIVVALSAIGLLSDLRQMRNTGIRPVLLGLGVWVSVVVSSLAVQSLLGAW